MVKELLTVKAADYRNISPIKRRPQANWQMKLGWGQEHLQHSASAHVAKALLLGFLGQPSSLHPIRLFLARWWQSVSVPEGLQFYSLSVASLPAPRPPAVLLMLTEDGMTFWWPHATLSCQLPRGSSLQCWAGFSTPFPLKLCPFLLLCNSAQAFSLSD